MMAHLIFRDTRQRRDANGYQVNSARDETSDPRGYSHYEHGTVWRNAGDCPKLGTRQTAHGGAGLQEHPGAPGISVDDFMETMGVMSASLQFDCSKLRRFKHRDEN
jgi:hypothetical protein